MPGFPVLTTLQPIFAVDMHKSIPPPPPAGPLMLPHPVVWLSGLSQMTGFMWAIAATSRASSPESGCPKPTAVGRGYACGRTHDAGPHPAHVWPNIFLPMILLGSSSKSEFGSGTVKVAVSPQGGDSLDMGVNVAYFMNFNLQCQDFPLPPTPTGFCFAVNYTVTAGFSLTDFLRGLVQCFVDAGLTWAVGFSCVVLGAALKAALSRLMSSRAFTATAINALKGGFSFRSEAGVRGAKGLMNDGAGFFASNGRVFVDGWRAMPKAVANAWKSARTDQVLGVTSSTFGTFGLGTPIGYAPAHAPVGGYAKGTVAYHFGNWVDGLFR
jgi:hypothetical protein